MIFQFFNKIAVISIFYSIITFLLCGISLIQGPHAAGIQSFAPWLQAATGLVGSYLILAIVKIALPTMFFKLPLFFGLPTLCALSYWSYESKMVRIGISAICMLLFIMHPVGFYAASYTLFWLIPMVIALLPQYSLLMAFGTTFTAHAAGSVMHLYLLNTLSADAWIALIPLVIVERTILALSVWAGYMLAQKLCDAYKAAYSSETYICK